MESGVMVWYQKFEYAISHWLMKATEHVTGCVLCSPGCFSMFRASSLIDTNVMKTYTTEPSEAMHYVQYDQGEDRWLCTLLLKQGYRIDYCAESDALTYAPEGFFDFYKQRRRWTPSTMANIMDLLKDSTLVIKKNKDISRLYIMYQILLFVSSVLTPGTIFLLIVGALLIGFPDISPMLGLLINLVPVVLFMLSCIFAKENTQLMFAAVLSAIYAIVMLIVLLGLLKTSLADGFCSSTTVIFCFVGGVFLLSATLHPEEGSCLIHGLLFFILIPSMSMLMFLYSIGNLNNVNWGTREKNSGQIEKSLLQTIVECFRKCWRPTDVSPQPVDGSKSGIQNSHDRNSGSNEEDSSNQDPAIFRLDCEFETQVKHDEVEFWDGLIKRYLRPTELSENQKKVLQDELKQLRNKACIMVFLSNAVLVVIVFILSKAETFSKSLVLRFPCGEGKEILIEPLSVLFTAVFGLLLLVQFIGMLYHRCSTIIHITAESTICRRNEDLERLQLTVSFLDTENANQNNVASSDVTRPLTLASLLQNVKNAILHPETLDRSRQRTLLDIIGETTSTSISGLNRDSHVV